MAAAMKNEDNDEDVYVDGSHRRWIQRRANYEDENKEKKIVWMICKQKEIYSIIDLNNQTLIGIVNWNSLLGKK